jgi:hypothetical protein
MDTVEFHGLKVMCNFVRPNDVGWPSGRGDNYPETYRGFRPGRSLGSGLKDVERGQRIRGRPRAILWPNSPRSIDQSDEATDIWQTHFASDGYGAEIWDHGRWFGEGNEGSAQGSPLNSLLSNVVWMNWTRNWNNRIFSYVRQKLQSAWWGQLVN